MVQNSSLAHITRGGCSCRLYTTVGNSSADDKCPACGTITASMSAPSVRHLSCDLRLMFSSRSVSTSICVCAWLCCSLDSSLRISWLNSSCDCGICRSALGPGDACSGTNAVGLVPPRNSGLISVSGGDAEMCPGARFLCASTDPNVPGPIGSAPEDGGLAGLGLAGEGAPSSADAAQGTGARVVLAPRWGRTHTWALPRI